MNSSLMYDIHGGLRGSFSREIGFDIRISQSRMKDRALFVNTPSAHQGVGLGDRFIVLYDRVDQLDISGELRYQHGEQVDVF
ncbi:hypothetical protein NPN13_24090, partial [Vibrio parahaemolyticus]|nr:hypothetical protein [Vibrio parahaemolyticus]